MISNTDPMLMLHNVSSSYGSHVVLYNISLTLHVGEIIAIMGPSGCGKSTLIRLAAQLMCASSGMVSSNASTRKDGIAVVFQNALLQPWLTVRENVELPGRISGKRIDAAALLESVRLEDVADRYPFQLSGGEQRRVAVARAIGQSPNLLCLDEPFSGIDEITREDLLVLMSRLICEDVPSCLLVTHSPYESVFLADRVIILGGVPTTVIGEVPVPLSQPRDVSTLDAEDFHNVIKQVRRVLQSSHQ